MKKLQIMAGMLSVLLLAGCGGAGASAKTTEGDPPQVASAAASGTTAAQNGNENPSEVVTQDEAERPGPVDAEPSGEKKTNSSAGEAKPAAEVPPVQVLPAETVPPETPPTGSAPSEPVTDEAAPQPEEKAFAMDYWLAYAKDYAVSIGLVLDQGTAGTWDRHRERRWHGHQHGRRIHRCSSSLAISSVCQFGSRAWQDDHRGRQE